jgi:heptosyltransferase-3
MRDDLLILFPGALGDFICFWPVLQALREQTHGRVTVVAKPEPLTLLPRLWFDCISIDRREIADLFAEGPPASSTRVLLSGFGRTQSWTGHKTHGFERRLGAITGGEVLVHPFRDLRTREHATAYYARCAGVVPKIPAPQLEPEAVQWARGLWTAHRLGVQTLVYHPGSGSDGKNWQGIDALIRRWRELGGKSVCLLGPADHPSLAPPADIVVDREPLVRVAALLQLAPLYLGNDSGISHLAGVIGSRGVALFGPSDPVAWRPLGRHLHVLAAPAACGRCGAERFCVHRLPLDVVLSALLAAAGPPRNPVGHPPTSMP